jgi:predicted transcriptional regulator
MLKYLLMKKTEAITLFGTSQADLAKALEITGSAVSQWPDELDLQTTDRVVGAAVRLKKIKVRKSPAQKAGEPA